MKYKLKKIYLFFIIMKQLIKIMKDVQKNNFLIEICLLIVNIGEIVEINKNDSNNLADLVLARKFKQDQKTTIMLEYFKFILFNIYYIYYEQINFNTNIYAALDTIITLITNHVCVQLFSTLDLKRILLMQIIIEISFKLF